MPLPAILLIDDDDSLVALLSDRLRREGYAARSCGDAAHAEQLLRDDLFDVILLDVMLPDRSGFEFCADLRDRGVETPILILTARGNITDRVTGLRLGADDYLPKPFEVQELLARIEVLRRRAGRTATESRVFEFGDVRVNFDDRSVLRSGRPVELSRREFQMLSHLIRNRGRVVLRDELLRTVWGYRTLPYTRTVDVHMWQLRRKLETDPQVPRFLRTIRGIGYLFVRRSEGELLPTA
ncbi:MAG TPA: response regulator transcription factor [Bryobacteraceae bacterium]|nr:response regulator transcription factor [Bryobacteraceae bacterium]